MSAVLTETSSTILKTPLVLVNQNIKLGIIGATNVGKSTLFNCLVRSSREAEVDNALFTTVDACIGSFQPEDQRIQFMASCHPEAPVRPATFTVMDSAGLVEGSFLEGAGMGVGSLKPLAHADMLLFLLRAFESKQIAHYTEHSDPLTDLLAIEQELLQMDLHRIETALSEIEGLLTAFPHTEALVFQADTLTRLWEHVSGITRAAPLASRKRTAVNRAKLPDRCLGQPVRLGTWDSQQREVVTFCKLYTAKEVIFLANLTAIDFNRQRIPEPVQALQAYLTQRADPCQLLTVSLEHEQRLYDRERAGQLEAYLAINMTHVSALPPLIDEVYRTLQIVRWYTATSEGVRVWLVRHGTTAAEGANLVDVDISRAFIRADVMCYEDFHLLGGDRLKVAMEGKVRAQGRKYILNDGDIVDFVYHHTRPQAGAGTG